MATDFNLKRAQKFMLSSEKFVWEEEVGKIEYPQAEGVSSGEEESRKS